MVSSLWYIDLQCIFFQEYTFLRELNIHNSKIAYICGRACIRQLQPQEGLKELKNISDMTYVAHKAALLSVSGCMGLDLG